MITKYYELKYELKDLIIVKATTVLIGLIVSINRTKNNALSMALHKVADSYDTRPSDLWDWVKGYGIK